MLADIPPSEIPCPPKMYQVGRLDHRRSQRGFADTFCKDTDGTPTMPPMPPLSDAQRKELAREVMEFMDGRRPPPPPRVEAGSGLQEMAPRLSMEPPIMRLAQRPKPREQY